MKTVKSLYLFCALACLTAQASSENSAQAKNRDYIKSLKELMVGVAAGCSEVLVDQPLVYFKNAIQQSKKVCLPKFALLTQQKANMGNLKLFGKDCLSALRVWYAGGLTNVTLVAPQTAVQLGVAAALPEQNKVLNSFIAGAVSGVFSPGELAIIHQQNMKEKGDNLNGVQMIKYLVKKHGVYSLFRGMLPMAIRDAGFSGFCFGVQGALKDKTKQHTDNQLVLTFGPGIVTGVASAIVTHPFDCIKTKMQLNLHDKLYGSLLKTAWYMYKTGGVTVFYKGVAPRGFRILSANIVMGVTADKLRRLLE